MHINSWMLTPETSGIIVALMALVGTIIVAISNQGKLSKSEAIKLEHRLTVVEQNLFSREDRDCLIKLNERVSNIMNTIATLVPKNLKNPKELNGILDKLSEKADNGGWAEVIDFIAEEMTAEDRIDLLDYLEKQSKSRSKQRRFWAGLYLGMLKLELNSKDPALCKPLIGSVT
jgi:hypothetical protein